MEEGVSPMPNKPPHVTAEISAGNPDAYTAIVVRPDTGREAQVLFYKTDGSVRFALRNAGPHVQVELFTGAGKDNTPKVRLRPEPTT